MTVRRVVPAALAAVPWLVAVALAVSLAFRAGAQEPSATASDVDRRAAALEEGNGALAARIEELESEMRALDTRGNRLRRELSRNDARIQTLLEEISARRAAIALEETGPEGQPIEDSGPPQTPPDDQCTVNPDGTTDCPSE